MKVSVNWISDFVDLPAGLSDRELSERITLSVCEVEGYERSGEIFQKVTVAEIISVENHPNADTLKLATVSLGLGKKTNVVCGAPNCQQGLKVPYAAIGTTFPAGFTLESKKIRGVVSNGMLCSESELGLSDDSEGLMILPSDVPVGLSLDQILGDKVSGDLILDIDNKSLTHRPDCWGCYGLAREFAAAFNTVFQDKYNAKWANALKEQIATDGGLAPVTLHIEPDSANRGFLGLSIDNVRVGTSPQWMQARLDAAGMRPINSIVDISNYAMLETGIPNHIFDRSTISGGKIIVRRAGKEMDFITLDGQERKLLASDTMVCDTEHESAIAGIMGGLESAVNENTTQIMVEVANWTGAEIRRTATRLGLRTDASQRYEKSLDSQQLEKCLLRIYELLGLLNPDVKAIGGIQSDNMPSPVELVIETSPDRIALVLGKEISEEDFTRILSSLGFLVRKIPESSCGERGRDCTHTVHVPTWRSTKDIECEDDIVEEIGRIIGYDEITPVSPKHDITSQRLSPGKVLFRRIQDFMVLRAKALEIMTYPLVGEALLKRAGWSVFNENLVLLNSLNPEQDRMRPSLIPSLLQATANNCKEHENFRIFECGRSYADIGGKEFSRDLHQLGIVFHQERENPFIELTNTVEDLLSFITMPFQMVKTTADASHTLIPENWTGSHPHEIMEVRIMGQARGIVFSLHPQIIRNFKINGRTAIALLDFTYEMNQTMKNKISFQSLDKYPGANFDITVVVSTTTYAADVVKVIRNMKIREIRRVGILDIFSLGATGKALTLRVEFRDSDKTLDSDFLRVTEGRIMTALEQAGYPIRS